MWCDARNITVRIAQQSSMDAWERGTDAVLARMEEQFEDAWRSPQPTTTTSRKQQRRQRPATDPEEAAAAATVASSQCKSRRDRLIMAHRRP